MLNVYREILPDSYLLILTTSSNAGGAEGLRHALWRAGTSGKPNVWIDCSSVSYFSLAALRILSDFHVRFLHRNLTLVLCHVPDKAAESLQQLPPAQRPPVVATLLEAATYCRSQRRPPRQPPTLRPPAH